MKKVFILCLISLLLVGCGNKKDEPIKVRDYGYHNYEIIELEPNGVLYFYVMEGAYGARGGIAPYYSKNGKLCRQVNGIIEEID